MIAEIWSALSIAGHDIFQPGGTRSGRRRSIGHPHPSEIVASSSSPPAAARRLPSERRPRSPFLFWYPATVAASSVSPASPPSRPPLSPLSSVRPPFRLARLPSRLLSVRPLLRRPPPRLLPLPPPPSSGLSPSPSLSRSPVPFSQSLSSVQNSPSPLSTSPRTSPSANGFKSVDL